MSLPQEIRSRLTLPAVAAPMFLCSGVALAVEACNAGIMGSLTRNHCRDMKEFEAQLAAVAEELKRFAELHPGHKVGPLAVNISTQFGNDEMRAHLALCKRFGASIVITSVGDPTAMVPMVHEAGLLHFHDATTLRFAEKAIAARVDGIVAIGAGGGGHSGTISHLAFIPQIRAMSPAVKPWRDIWSAGQGIGLIHDIPPVAELVRRLRAEYVAACSMPDMSEAAATAAQLEVRDLCPKP